MARSRFLLIVFDALRPDMIAPGRMPHLASLLARAHVFPRAHAVFPSETRVNTTSLATGTPPAGHGIVSNVFFDPKVARDRPFNTGNAAMLDAAVRARGAGLVTAAALGDVLKDAGRTFAAVSAGTPGNARFVNPRADILGQATVSVHGPASCSTAVDFAALEARIGPVPVAAVPNLPRCAWATRALLDYVIPVHDPDVASIWFSEPDIAYHYRGIGSPESLDAMRGVDAELGRILDRLGGDPAWRFALLSDHGQVESRTRIDPLKAMRTAGFKADQRPGPDVDYVVVPASSGNVQVRDGDRARLARLVAWMQEQPWCGSLLTRAGRGGIQGDIPGTFSRALVRGTHVRAPQLFYTLRSEDTPNRFGWEGGTAYWMSGVPEGGGVHGGLHPREIANLIAFAGDGIVPGRAALPAGICDVAPTVLTALGVPPPPGMTGRVLAEAFGTAADLADGTETLTAGVGDYAQALSVSRAGAHRYIDGGWRAG